MAEISPIQKVLALRQVPMFAGLETETLLEVVNRTEQRRVPGGTALTRTGEAGDELFVLLTGRAEVTRDGERLAELRPGAFFGELSLIDGKARTADVVASDDSDVLVMARRDFQQLLNIPHLALVVVESLCERLRRAATDG